MKTITFGSIILLIIYSILLIFLEFQFGQDYVRFYFTDISGPVRFYAVNTTFSVFFLWACALIFFINLSFLDKRENRDSDRIFYVSQIFIFAYLGADDRFMLHEAFGLKFHINDAFILLGIGFIEIGFLFFYGNMKQWSKPTKLYLLTAAGFFSLMTFIDAFMPNELLLRLTIEDLTKTWAAFFLFMFALEIYKNNINRLKQQVKNNIKKI